MVDVLADQVVRSARRGGVAVVVVHEPGEELQSEPGVVLGGGAFLRVAITPSLGANPSERRLSRVP